MAGVLVVRLLGLLLRPHVVHRLRFGLAQLSLSVDTSKEERKIKKKRKKLKP